MRLTAEKFEGRREASEGKKSVPPEYSQQSANGIAQLLGLEQSETRF